MKTIGLLLTFSNRFLALPSVTATTAAVNITATTATATVTALRYDLYFTRLSDSTTKGL